MTDDAEPIDVAAGMVSAAIAPAMVAAVIGLAGGPFLAATIFGFALVVAGAHVVLLALPLHSLLRRFGWPIRPATVIVAATVIGAMPATLWLGIGLAFWGGLFGFIGGCTFCGFAWRGWVGGND